MHEWRSETEQAEEAEAQRRLYEKRLHDRKLSLRAKEHAREHGGAAGGGAGGGGGAGAGGGRAARQPHYPSDLAEFPLGEEGEYPELQEAPQP